MTRKAWQRGTPLDSVLQEKLRMVVKERGEKKTAEMLEIGMISVARAAAGFGLRRGTANLIKMKLEMLAA